MKRLFDKSVWIVALSAALTLSGLSFIFCPTAHAGGTLPPAAATVAGHTPTDASKTAMTLDPDEDGDELLEHWNSPKYSAEERFQLAEIGCAFAVAAVVTALRRRSLWRAARHG